MSTDTTRAEGVEGGGGAAAAAAEVREEVESDSVAKRRGRPPLSYTDDFHTPSSITLQSIGVVRSVYKVCSDIYLHMVDMFLQLSKFYRLDYGHISRHLRHHFIH